MENTPRATIESLLQSQRTFFATHETKIMDFRIHNLKKFRSAILRYESKIAAALWTDLHKSYEEAYMTEISLVLGEINNHLKHIKRWAKPKKAKTPLVLLPSHCRLLHEPLGVALIMAPWNYPFQLLMNPLVGAISSGCCAMLKPSPYTPTVARVMQEMLSETFDANYIAVAQGNREVNQVLLEQRFDVIFFTGSPSLGKTVMKAASQYLTPVVLELGGKSPCIVDRDANIAVAAKRIAWGKCINAGQTCIAPDYLFVHKEVKEQLLEKMEAAIREMHGDDPRHSKFYPRIVNEQAMERLQLLMKHGKIRFGGEVEMSEKYIAPTLIDEIQPDFPVMQEEIFGPVLPVMTFEDISEVLSYVNGHEKPLAFYYFGKNRAAKEILGKTTSGGGCINDTLLHIVNHRMPFGGVGNSGMGKYHGKYSFMAFSNARAMVFTPSWIELPLKYPPYKYFKWIKKIL
ncbi:MAG: aldehyde dehydrogenase [Bacteroidales bacterium]|nr:aldehyde dehydrogenase [Bacteroidales bacterium]